MDVIDPRGCGLDIHQQTGVACLLTSEAGQPPVKTSRTFGTMTADLLTWADWRHTAGGTHVAMELRAYTGARSTTCWKAS